MIKIPAGKYSIGNNRLESQYSDNETKEDTLVLESFYIDTVTVTNLEFDLFIKDSHYITEAERVGYSFVFYQLIPQDIALSYNRVPELPWWLIVPNANWRQPEGEGSTIISRMDHPVVHVSHRDAVAYCVWAGKRLPTEAEWEIAAKGGTNYRNFPWGEEKLVNGVHYSNVWQGQFPSFNTLEDGFLATAPAKYYAPNGYGCYQMIGNVWEWCANEAYIDIEYFKFKKGYDIWQERNSGSDTIFAMKGGSFLCHPTYCDRNRISARNGTKGISTASNIGFRCVKDND